MTTSDADATPKKTSTPRKRPSRKRKNTGATRSTTTKKQPIQKKTASARTHEHTKPNVDIKSDEHMLAGINDLDAYIAQTKATSSEKKAHLIAQDGTDLLHLPGIYAVVPHAKGDHKLVYLTSDAPIDLVEDPKHRTPGEMYIKNGRKIYMVALTMKEHPTLKNNRGTPYDVWVIATPDQLPAQIAAIKEGVGGGENFGDPVFIVQPTPTTKEKEVDTNAEDKPQDLLQPSEDVVTQETAPTQDPSSDKTTTSDDDKQPTPKENDEEDKQITEEEVNIDAIQLPNVEDVIDEDATDIDNIDIPDVEETLQEEQPTPIETVQSEEPIDLSLQEDEHQDDESNTGSPQTDDTTTQLPEEHSEETQENTQSTQDDTGQNQASSALLGQSTSSDTVALSPEEQGVSGHFRTDDTPPVTISEDTTTQEDGSAHHLFGEEKSPTTQIGQEEPVIAENIIDSPLFQAHHEESPTATTTGIQEAQTVPDDTRDIVHEEANPEKSDVEQPEQPAEQAPDTGVTESKESPTANAFDLDDITLDTPDETPGSSSPDTVSSSVAQDVATTTTGGALAKKFPLGMVIRLVIAIVIVIALVLILKIMFTGTKAPALDAPAETISGSVVDDTDEVVPDDQEDTTDTPPDDTNTDGSSQPTDEPTNPDSDTSTPTDQLTLPEITAKLENQQTEARKLLNMAKLLDHKQAIKFSLASMLKAGNLLERIKNEQTITAQDLIPEAQKIDLYLAEASKLIE